MDIEHLTDDRSAPETELLKLFRAAFGGADSLWPANQRWLVREEGRLIAHVAVQRRWFLVGKRYLEGWFVGTVCTVPDRQRSRIASELLRVVHQDLRQQELPFAVLNCAKSLIGFYKGVGYSLVADRGTYLRGGRAVTDNDSALAIALNPEFDLSMLHCGSFPFGFDF